MTQARNSVQFVSSPIKSIDVDADEKFANVQLEQEAEGQVGRQLWKCTAVVADS